MTRDDAALPSPDAPVIAGEELNDLIWEVSVYIDLMGETALAQTPLTLPSSGMLMKVLDEPGITVAEMSRRIPKSQQAISQVAARLEKLGLIERRLGPGRGVGLHVTDEGRAMAEVGRDGERELARRLRELLGSDRYDTLYALLAEARTILREAR